MFDGKFSQVDLMGTAVAKRSIWTVIADNPFPFFDAEEFRDRIAACLQEYGSRIGGHLTSPPLHADAGEIFRVHLYDVPFPDGPGRCSLEVTAYKAFGRLYLSMMLDHDRLFRALDGTPGSRLYLHDYKFVRSYGHEQPPRITEIEEALIGVEQARTSVQRRNRAAAGERRSYLGQIRIALESMLSAPSEDAGESGVPEAAHRPLHRRIQVLEAIDEERRRPVKIRIRRRRPRPEDPETP